MTYISAQSDKNHPGEGNGPTVESLLSVIRDGESGQWFRFSSPSRVLVARRMEEVLPAIERAEDAVRKKGICAAGFLSYEAAPAFDGALPGRADAAFPLLVMGLYGAPEVIRSLPHPERTPPGVVHWTPSTSRDEYERAIGAIREEIRQGETYQVNYTFRLHARSPVSPWQMFLRLMSGGEPPYGAYVETPEWCVISTSPELFFSITGNLIRSRPMKGTAPRGRWPEDDRARRDTLRHSEKDRAENLMIVDMVRNDIGRIAHTGTVRVPLLFALEKYPTVWQMTSTVTAETTRSLTEIFTALFPPASITGAPKKSAMEIIHRLETTPRRVYTGTIGFMTPGRAQFNVAIRTLVVNRRSEEMEYGIGSGIVWQSEAGAEWEECLAKSRVLREPPREFELLETMLYTAEEGFHLLDRHLARLAASAEYFDFTVDFEAIREALFRRCREAAPGRAKVRLRVSREGVFTIEAGPLVTPVSGGIVVGLARTPVDPEEVTLYHKTTDRSIYERALGEAPGCDDVLLFNGAGEMTESTVANLAVRVGGRLCTPPLQCGVLPGTCRAWMLERGLVEERVVTVREILECPEIYLMNSVRGVYPITLRRDSASPR